MRPLSALYPLPLALALACYAGGARAEESAADKAAADALFADAKKLMKEKKWDEACPKLAESLGLSERLGTLLNLATCHAEQGKTASAWAEFNEAAALAKREKSKDREKFARQSANELEKQLVRVSFKLPPGVEGATLELDGNQIGASALSTPLPIDPGSHSVKVSAPGKRTWTKQLVVENKPGSMTLEVPALDAETEASAPTPEPPVPTKPPPSKPEPKAESSGNALAWVALGVGVVGVGVGSYFGLRTFSKKSEADDHCGKAIGQTDSSQCDATGVDLRDQAKSSATLSTVAFAVGAAGIGVGTVLLLTGGSKNEKASRATIVAPTIGPRGAALVVDGRF